MSYLPSRIIGTHESNFGLTTREHEDLDRHGVPATALREPTPVRAGHVEFLPGGRFEFEQHRRLSIEVKAVRAFLILIEDEMGDAIDIAAWSPHLEKVALWRGIAWAIGQDQALAPRLTDELPVWRDPLGWLREGRRGLVLLRPMAAAPVLDDAGPLAAEDRQHGIELRAALTRKGPRIVIPDRVEHRKAA